MQNPKLKLVPKTWYKTSLSGCLYQGRSESSRRITEVPKGALVMFLGYHPGSVNVCKVMFGEYYGWLCVPNKYKSHTHFFLKAETL